MIKLNIKTQPNDETCGPTSLHAIYSYYNDDISLNQVIDEVQCVRSGGTIGSLLGKHALQRNYQTQMYIYNLDIFDPTWFFPHKLSNKMLSEKLSQQLKYTQSKRFIETTYAYLDYIKLGGQLRLKDLTRNLLNQYFAKGVPILTGLSATYLYHSAREYDSGKGKLIYDDLRGDPCGHFVVLCGYDDAKRHVIVADPHRQNPISGDNYYKVNINRLINAILLGVLTYDANLLIIEPKR